MKIMAMITLIFCTVLILTPFEALYFDYDVRMLWLINIKEVLLFLSGMLIGKFYYDR